jgi:hypothetical protein
MIKENIMRSNNTRISARLIGVLTIFMLFSTLSPNVWTQSAESQVSYIKLGSFWTSVSAIGAKSPIFDPRFGFFPNDYNIIVNNGKDGDSYAGGGFTMTTTDWLNPDGEVELHASYGPTNTYLESGLVIDTLRSYIRYPYSSKVMNFVPMQSAYPGIVDASKFTAGTYDQLVEVKSQHIFNVNVHRRILAWSQTYNDDYVISDIELENVGTDTLHNFAIGFYQGTAYVFLSSIKNPVPSSSEAPSFQRSWLHYYGGRVGDSARVFYEYSAANPTSGWDNMGMPAVSQGGRLTYANIMYWAVLHASAQPYFNSQDDVDDFHQPKVTYIGNATAIPNPGSSDEFGSKDYWAINGGFSDRLPMDTINSFPGTHHGQNNDDINTADFSSYAGGSYVNNNQKRWMAFGPYTFLAGQKIHIVYASGQSGIGLQKARQVGERWKAGTLTDPSGLPDPEKGFLPQKFKFPAGATELDKRKDRWISTGIDSVMKSAFRAKWNFDHHYNIPQAPPPPEQEEITGKGDGVIIKWKDLAAESMPNFAGYRIMRRVGNYDTVYYHMIYDSGPDDKGSQHTFVDSSIVLNSDFYYYIQAKAKIDDNDPNADPLSRGKVLYSSRMLDPDLRAISPPARPNYGSLSKVRVSPNPYNINDPQIPSHGWPDGRRITFYNLPPTATIRIYTENGDKVRELFHAGQFDSGSEDWDLTTTSEQIINSGVYIAVIESPSGEIAYQKFVVVR